MSSLPPLSVLLPVYNTRADWLWIAVDSILQQTYRNFELVVVNDGSTNPETLEALAVMPSKDSRIRVEHNPKNMGLPQTLNRGLRLCSHQWVARMDGDDYAYPQRFERQLEYLKNHPEVKVLGSLYRIMGTDRGVQLPEKHADIAVSLLVGCAIAHPSVIYSKDFILGVGGYAEVGNAEDYDLWVRLALDCPGVIANIQEFLLDYRVVEGREQYRNIQRYSHKEIQDRYIQGLGLNISSSRLPPYFEGMNSPDFSVRELVFLDSIADDIQDRVRACAGNGSISYLRKLRRILDRHYRENINLENVLKLLISKISYKIEKMMR